MPHKDPDVRREYTRKRMAERRQRARDERNAERLAALEARTTEPTLCAQAGGLFDGEGTATITTSNKDWVDPDRNYSRCIVSLTSTDREVIDWLQAHWGGFTCNVPPKKATHNHAWAWTLNGDNILPFLHDIQPYLISDRKKEVVRLVMECQMARWDGQRRPGYREKIEGYHEQVRTLNRRGRSA